MKPKVTMYKAPKGLEQLDCPKELDEPRRHIVYMVSNLMKLYGVERVDCNLSNMGPTGVTSPTFKMLDAYKTTLPPSLVATQITAMKSVIPLMMAYGILSMELEFDEQDHIAMLSVWGATANRKAVPEREQKPIIGAPSNGPAKPTA